MKHSRPVLVLAETAILVAIAVVLDVLFGAIYSLPFGGSVSLAMLPIFVVAARRGWKTGLLAGLAFGLIQAFFVAVAGNAAAYILSLPQFVMDYLVSFAVLGLAGLVPGQAARAGRFAAGILVGSTFRLLAASVTGLLFWRAFIPDELDFMGALFGFDVGGLFASEAAAVFAGAFLYNLLYLVPSAILCVVVGLVLRRRGLLVPRTE